MSDDRLDRAIERAVREMTNVDAPADVKARVMARLEQRPPQVFTWPRLAAAAAAAALIAFVLMRPPAPDSARIASVSKPAEAPITQPREMPQAGPARPGIPRDAQAVRRRTNERTVVATVAVEMPESIPPLDEIYPLTIVPPQPRSIERPAVSIAPLPPISDVEVEPLPFPPGGWD